MSLPDGAGVAHDATVEVNEPEMPPEVAAYMQAMQDRALEQYERNHRTPGTREYDAHVAQLRRLHAEAKDALARCRSALDKAREHMAGKEDAVREAETMLDSAELALAEVVGPKERSDGLE